MPSAWSDTVRVAFMGVNGARTETKSRSCLLAAGVRFKDGIQKRLFNLKSLRGREQRPGRRGQCRVAICSWRREHIHRHLHNSCDPSCDQCVLTRWLCLPFLEFQYSKSNLHPWNADNSMEYIWKEMINKLSIESLTIECVESQNSLMYNKRTDDYKIFDFYIS